MSREIFFKFTYIFYGVVVSEVEFESENKI
jgi:hypothetical protein